MGEIYSDVGPGFKKLFLVKCSEEELGSFSPVGIIHGVIEHRHQFTREIVVVIGVRHTERFIVLEEKQNETQKVNFFYNAFSSDKKKVTKKKKIDTSKIQSKYLSVSNFPQLLSNIGGLSTYFDILNFGG